VSLVLAHLLPLLAGTCIHAALVERPRGADGWLRALGNGYLLGLALVVALLQLLRPTPQSAFATVAVLLATVVLATGVLARRRPLPAPAVVAAPAAEPPWTRWLLLALLAWLALRGCSLATEVALRPLFPWDAWATWSVKAKAWYLGNGWHPFVGFDAWLADPQARYVAAWFYPEAIPTLEVWFASAAGGWRVAAVLSAWPGLWLAGLVLLVGQVRAASAPWWLALVAGFCWASLPLVQTHVALAGYADLPMTVMFGAAALSLARAALGHGRRHLLLAVLFALLLPAIKQEGALWLLVLAVGALHLLLADRGRRRLLPMAGAIVLAWTALFGLRLPLPAVGWVEAGWGYLRTADGASLALAWRPVGGQLAETLLLAPNWHLLWWLSPIVLLATAPVWRALAGLGWVMTLGLAAIVFIFLFTDAALWADNLTAVNRVLMQLTLAWVGWLALLSALAIARRERLRAALAATPAEMPG
jgi:hypothetical protein